MGVTKDAILLCLFPFSLLGKAKQWFYANKDRNTTWDNCSTMLLAKFFSTGKTNALHGRISSFQQQHDESIPETLGTLQRLHIRMSSSWDGGLATHVDFLSRVDK